LLNISKVFPLLWIVGFGVRLSGRDFEFKKLFAFIFEKVDSLSGSVALLVLGVICERCCDLEALER